MGDAHLMVGRGFTHDHKVQELLGDVTHGVLRTSGEPGHVGAGDPQWQRPPSGPPHEDHAISRRAVRHCLEITAKT